MEWLVALVPFTYKSGAQFPNVSAQLSTLAGADGVDLDLHGMDRRVLTTHDVERERLE